MMIVDVDLVMFRPFKHHRFVFTQGTLEVLPTLLLHFVLGSRNVSS